MNRGHLRVGIAATAAVAMLAACGGDAGEADGEVTSITVITSQAPWNPAYDAVVAAYQEATGRQVDLRAFPNDEVRPQMLNDVQGGTGTYDVYQVNEFDVAQFNANGWLRPLTDVDPDYSLDPETYTYDNLPYWNAEERQFSESGELTTVPLLGNLQVLMYRADLYEELGLEVPTTWEEVIENGRTAMDAGAVRYGFITRYQGVPGAPNVTYDFSGIFYHEGGQLFRNPGTDWTPTIDSPEGVRAGEIFQELASLGPADTKSIGQAEAIAIMQAGDALQILVVAAAAAGMENEANSNIAGDVGYAPVPGGVTPTGTWNLAIPAGLPDDRARAALHFIDWVTSREGMEVFAANGGIPTRSDAFESPDLSPAAAANLAAVRDSAETAVGSFRVEFASEFLNGSETIIADLAAGDITPEEAMSRLQDVLTQAVENADYPME